MPFHTKIKVVGMAPAETTSASLLSTFLVNSTLMSAPHQRATRSIGITLWSPSDPLTLRTSRHISLIIPGLDSLTKPTIISSNPGSSTFTILPNIQSTANHILWKFIMFTNWIVWLSLNSWWLEYSSKRMKNWPMIFSMRLQSIQIPLLLDFFLLLSLISPLTTT